MKERYELLESINREKTAIEFNNDVVQLVHELLRAKILELADSPKILKGKLTLHPDNALKLHFSKLKKMADLLINICIEINVSVNFN